MRTVESANDLPDRFGAMFVKELRQNMRRASFVYPFLGIQVLAILVGLHASVRDRRGVGTDRGRL